MYRTLVVGYFQKESFALHILDTLKSLNLDAFALDVSISLNFLGENKYVRRFEASFQQILEKTTFYENHLLNKILSVVDINSLNLIIVCHDFLTPNQINLIKKFRKIKIVLWFPDPIGQIHRGMFMNSDYDILFFKDKFICEVLKNELNLNTVYLPECCNPNLHKPVELNRFDIEKYECDLTTAGNLPSNRIRLFGQLSEYNYSIKLWGNEAPYWSDSSKIEKYIQNEYVANEEKSKAFKGAKIVINNLRISEVGGTNVRTFEIAACKAFQITTFRKGFYELYKHDEVITYDSFSDLLEKINYFLPRIDERNEFAHRAYCRTISEHTYEKRLETMFLKLDSLV